MKHFGSDQTKWNENEKCKYYMTKQLITLNTVVPNTCIMAHCTPHFQTKSVNRKWKASKSENRKENSIHTKTIKTSAKADL